LLLERTENDTWIMHYERQLAVTIRRTFKVCQQLTLSVDTSVKMHRE